MRKPAENPNNRDIVAIQWFPGMRPDLLLALVKPATKALIITGTALGTVATDFNPAIRELTNRGVAIFVLSDNIRENHGTLRIIDQVQTENVRAGVVHLEKINARDLQKFHATVLEEIDSGKTGASLAEAVKSKFAYSPGEKKPRGPGGAVWWAEVKRRQKQIDRALKAWKKSL